MGRNAYCMRFRPVPSEGESFMASKQKILIVDDDNNIAELISLYLTKECYDTKIVNDGEQALIAFEHYKPNMLLLDLMLPGIDGYQVCREIRAKSDVPIIMLSAKGEVFDKVLGLAPTTIYSSPLTQRSLWQESRPCSDASSLQSRRPMLP